jgi:ribonuclease D
VDKPRKWVLDDQACVAIAQAMPTTTAALAAIDGVPPSVVRKQGEVLVEVVRKAQALDEEALPAQSRTLSAEQRQRLKAMRAFVRTRAGELDIAPELLCSGGDLELLLRQIDGEQIREPERWHGWRNAQIIAPLREAGTQL